jgi:hypothetical protein
MNISKTSVRRDVEDLRCKCYGMSRGQFIPETGKRMQEWLKKNLPQMWEKKV